MFLDAMSPRFEVAVEAITADWWAAQKPKAVALLCEQLALIYKICKWSAAFCFRGWVLL